MSDVQSEIEQADEATVTVAEEEPPVVEEAVVSEGDESAEEGVPESDDVSEEVTPSLSSAEDPVDAKWYILQCHSTHEYKVRQRIEQLIDEMKWQEKVFRVLIPEEETIELKDNKRVEKTTKIFPGYVFVQAIMDDSIWYELRRIQGVSKFIGTKNAPTPVMEDEILKVLRKIGDRSKKIEVDFEKDEVIKVIGGPFRGYSGPISEINADRGKLKALISIFGRETPVELDFNQIEKVVQ